MKYLVILASLLAATACGGKSKSTAAPNQPLPGEPSASTPAPSAAKGGGRDVAGAGQPGTSPDVMVRPASPPIDVEEARPLVVRYGELMRDLNDSLDQIGDCPEAGHFIVAWSSTNLGEIDRLEQQIGRLTEEQSRQLVDELTVVGAESVRISGHVDRCAADGEFADAVQSAFGGGGE